jgi:hypothetical protein
MYFFFNKRMTQNLKGRKVYNCWKIRNYKKKQEKLENPDG